MSAAARRVPLFARSLVGRLLWWLSAGLRVRFIDSGEQPYMERYHLFRLGPLSAYLHHFVAADGEREVHDHPWPWALGLVLTGWYEEERLTGFDPACGWHRSLRRIRPWRPNLITARTFHRIALVKPGTWTLFVHWRRSKGWGFLRPVCSPAGGRGAVLYHQPFDIERSADWSERAPVAREVRL